MNPKQWAEQHGIDDEELDIIKHMVDNGCELIQVRDKQGLPDFTEHNRARLMLLFK